MRLFFALVMLLACYNAGAQLLAPVAPRPDAMMSALTADVMKVLRQDAGTARTSELAELIDKRVVPLFNFPRMTRIALARNWSLASPAEQAALTAQFQALLVRTYSQALAGVRDSNIDYKPLRAAAGESDVTVRSALRRPGVEPLTIDYDMADGAAGWQVYDVKLAGVSLVLVYRESFAATVRSSGIPGLIKALEDKNRQNEAAAPDASKLAALLMIYGAPRAAKP